jgi:hypothetical protein
VYWPSPVDFDNLGMTPPGRYTPPVRRLIPVGV